MSQLRPFVEAQNLPGLPFKEWVLRKNCALSPRQVGMFYLSLVTLSTLIGLGFTLVGAWYVLPFGVLETGLLGIALLVYARHALDHERVTLDGEGLEVEAVVGSQRRVVQLNARWVKVEINRRRRVEVFVVGQGHRLSVGRFVDDGARGRFAQELKSVLSSI